VEAMQALFEIPYDQEMGLSAALYDTLRIICLIAETGL
jgi:hypothetical protein